MAANHCFDMEVVGRVYAASGDLAKTDAVLLRMRESAERAAKAALRELGVDEGPEPFVLRHRRRASGSSAEANGNGNTGTKRSPSSSQRKKRHADGDDVFRPQPLERDLRAETEYTPPASSRAGKIARAARKGRLEEGLERERRRASGGGTLSAFARGARAQGQRLDADMEDDVPRIDVDGDMDMDAPFEAFAGGNVEVLRELERRDVQLGMRRVVDVACYMMDGAVSPGR
ncbi:hypothetical protein B0H17DRAFT_1092993 [Mycena rosella]|uniref:Uncharacterized protein n=1 Tax=Mycena rosella TaxID=1033263 RepID=A0AAD7CXH3_MYCRO|nr:hypothetical protein B0H17DRAFT_1092993 [Mycena rosella]